MKLKVKNVLILKIRKVIGILRTNSVKLETRLGNLSMTSISNF
jgi:hypothetical protein